MAADQPISPPPPAPTFATERTENFASSYANSAYFESSAFDLRIIFGQLDQNPDGGGILKQHLAVSIPWDLAKLSIYWLQSQVIAHELETGRVIGLRESVRPPVPSPLTAEQERDPIMQKYYAALKKLREEFIASL